MVAMGSSGKNLGWVRLDRVLLGRVSVAVEASEGSTWRMDQSSGLSSLGAEK